MEDLQAREGLGIAENLAEDLLLESLYIDWCIRGLSSN